MLSPTLGRFLSRDPLSQGSEPVVLYDNENGAWLKTMLNMYTYASSNPVNRIDPSGLACKAANPPTSAMPIDDDYNPISSWRPQPAAGYPISFGSGRVAKFSGVTCDCCTMDIEVVARAYRYYRYDTRSEIFVGYRGQQIGVSNDPRDFFSLLVLTVCKTNITCNGKRQPDSFERHVSSPLQRDGRGVYIRQGAGDIENTLANFSSTDACDFADDAIRHVQQNTRPGVIDPRLPG